MPDFRLPLSQRKDVFDDTVTVGLDPAAFKWSEVKGTYGPNHRIVHAPTGSHLTIDGGRGTSDDQFAIEAWPTTFELRGRPNSWSGLRQVIKRWLVAVKVEVDTPDVWALAQQERAWLVDDGAVNGNAPFTPQEREEIPRRLAAVEAFILKESASTEEHQVFVREQFKYLTGSVARLGKRDWKGTFTATLVSIAIQLSIDKTTGHRLVELVSQLFGPVLLTAGRLLSQ